MSERFAFGKNWANFLEHLDEARIREAENSLCDKLDVNALEGKSFIDIGSGSGLFSLAAYRLGAKVFSFDYDVDSVACTKYLKEKFAPNDDRWTVEHGSVLDKEYMQKFSQFDVVYSWGVLHHTGNMLQAFENVVPLVKPEGKLFISIYNDQGYKSKIWAFIKKSYVKSSGFVKAIIIALCAPILFGPRIILDTITTGNPLKTWNNYKKKRGMSAFHDIVDWVGGYPFEVAKPEQILSFFLNYKMQLQKLKTCGGMLGCNEFVFYKGE